MKKIFSLLIVLANLSCFAQKVSLQLNLKIDSTYYLNTNANLSVIQDINGTHQVITVVLGGRVSHKVMAVADTVYEMEVAYREMNVHMDMAGKLIDFSSDDKNDMNLMSKIMRSMLDKTFTMKISRGGKVLEVKGLDNMYNGMFASLPGLSDEQKAKARGQLEQSFGEKSIRGNFQDSFALFPGRQVGVNDEWVTTTKLESVISTDIKTTYTLKSISDKAYVIHGSAVIRDENKPDFKVTNRIPIRCTNISGSATVDLLLNKTTGCLTESKVSKSVQATGEIKDTPQTPGGMKFPVSIIADMTITGKK